MPVALISRLFSLCPLTYILNRFALKDDGIKTSISTRVLLIILTKIQGLPITQYIVHNIDSTWLYIMLPLKPMSKTW
jgi:hypothetical protein